MFLKVILFTLLKTEGLNSYRYYIKATYKTKFARWTEYVLDLRQKTLDKEIEIDDYTKLIRK